MTTKRQKKKNKKKEDQPKKERNWLAIHAHNRKGGAHTDRKKERNKRKCRGKVRNND